MHVPFSGFTERDFAVFDLPDFATRMPELKANITPKLKELGEELAPRLSEACGQTLYPHVAQHLRRSVNPPAETWVAFSRDRRGYKPYIHFRVAINGEGVKVACYLEEYSDDKPALAENLKRNAAALADYLKGNPQIRSHDHEANYGRLLDGRTLSEADITHLADRLSKVKSQHANWAIRFAKSDRVVRSPELADTALKAVGDLLPLYRLGSGQE
jgi:uncharacterized protein YktB (UPF0637 family)